jgi:hypothetical protein
MTRPLTPGPARSRPWKRRALGTGTVTGHIEMRHGAGSSGRPALSPGSLSTRRGTGRWPVSSFFPQIAALPRRVTSLPKQHWPRPDRLARRMSGFYLPLRGESDRHFGELLTGSRPTPSTPSTPSLPTLEGEHRSPRGDRTPPDASPNSACSGPCSAAVSVTAARTRSVVPARAFESQWARESRSTGRTSLGP